MLVSHCNYIQKKSSIIFAEKKLIQVRLDVRHDGGLGVLHAGGQRIARVGNDKLDFGGNDAPVSGGLRLWRHGECGGRSQGGATLDAGIFFKKMM